MYISFGGYHFEVNPIFGEYGLDLSERGLWIKKKLLEYLEKNGEINGTDVDYIVYLSILRRNCRLYKCKYAKEFMDEISE